jgi:hypothetical protein
VTVSPAARKAVLERDNYACVCCGQSIIGRPYSLQHRRARKMGGSRLPWIDSPQNLLTVLGSATTGCHARMERRGQADKDNGYVISEWPEVDPRLIPVQVVTELGPATVWLTAEGGLSNDPPADSELLLSEVEARIPCEDRRNGQVCGACPACLAAQVADPRYGRREHDAP